MEEKMKTIRQRIKEEQDQQKSYVDVHCVDHSYEAGDQVFLRIKPHKSLIKFGKGAKISPRFMGPFDIVERNRLVAYRLPFLDSLRHMHDVFHVFVLRHYISDPTHVIDMSSLQVLEEGVLKDKSICIPNHCIRQL
jgi:hypothetical protein